MTDDTTRRTTTTTTDTDLRPEADREPRVRPARAMGTWDRETASLLGARDFVRWGPVFAGLVTSLTSFMLLSLLAVAIGLTAVNPAEPGQQQALSTGSAIVSAVIGIVAFFLGGLVAARAGAIVGRPAGALNGFLVWALGVVLILILGVLGLSALLGAAGGIVAQMGLPSQAPTPPPVNPGEAAAAARDSALVAFLSLAIPAIAAAIGGAVGAAEDVEERMPST